MTAVLRALQLRRFLWTILSAFAISVAGTVVFSLADYPADEMPVAVTVLWATWVVVSELLLYLAIVMNKKMLSRSNEVINALDLPRAEHRPMRSGPAWFLALLLSIAVLVLAVGLVILIPDIILRVFQYRGLPEWIHQVGTWMAIIGGGVYILYLILSWGMILLVGAIARQNLSPMSPPSLIVRLYPTLDWFTYLRGRFLALERLRRVS